MHELAEQSVAGTDPVRLADLAGRVLEESEFEPGFDAEPLLLAELEHALEAVKADMQATGMAGPVRVTFVEAPGSYLRNAFANFRGSFSYTGGIAPSQGRDRLSALLAVADDVQDAIMGSLMTVWPVCPDHSSRRPPTRIRQPSRVVVQRPRQRPRHRSHRALGRLRV